MTPIHHVTPLLRSSVLSAHHGADVWLKLDSAQPSASFKLRGMGHACQQAVQRGARHLVSSSGGNAGYAVAYAGRQLGVPVTVVVPRRTAERMRRLIEGEGAVVQVHGEVWDDAHEHALQLAPSLSGVVIHPFDAPDVWAGHASLVEEVHAEGVRPEAVVVSVGGGGLMCGVLQGMHGVGWADTPLVAVETEGAASFAAAMAAQRPVTLAEIGSLALTLGAKTVCERAVQWCQAHPIHSWLCSDRAAVQACGRFLDDHRVLVEPACGAALASIYDSAEPLRGRSVLVVVCGGASVTQEQLAGWQEQVRGPAGEAEDPRES
ncbi:MAG: pyridoxal-phosphate dependent enzyme [Myxococcales bacterium]|nr:pyridoxal-phosphate dependent enzyme [Myxococcales bacterium]